MTKTTSSQMAQHFQVKMSLEKLLKKKNLYTSDFCFISHSLPTLLHGCMQKSRAGGQAGQGDRGEDGAGATTDPGLRRDQVGPLAATDHLEERGYRQTVNWAAVLPTSPICHPTLSAGQ